MNYSENPTCLATTDPTLASTDMLYVAVLRTLVSYPTRVSCTGIRFRQLNLSEMAKIFGFPGKFSILGLNPGIFPLVPLQILDTVLQLIIIQRQLISASVLYQLDTGVCAIQYVYFCVDS